MFWIGQPFCGENFSIDTPSPQIFPKRNISNYLIMLSFGGISCLINRTFDEFNFSFKFARWPLFQGST